MDIPLQHGKLLYQTISALTNYFSINKLLQHEKDILAWDAESVMDVLRMDCGEIMVSQ
jgi:hypothetical protein